MQDGGKKKTLDSLINFKYPGQQKGQLKESFTETKGWQNCYICMHVDPEPRGKRSQGTLAQSEQLYSNSLLVESLGKKVKKQLEAKNPAGRIIIE